MKKLLLLFALCAVCSGCAMFKVGDLPPAPLVPAKAGVPKPSLTYSMRGQYKMFGTQDIQSRALNVLSREFEDAAWESGYFSEISPYNKNADLKMNIQFIDTGNPAAMIPAVITGLSMYTIPSWASDHFEIRITERSGDLKKTYAVKDTVRLVQWLPMAFLFPFHNFSVIEDVRENMYLTLLEQFRRDGLLVKKEEPIPVISEEPPIGELTAEAGLAPAI